MKCLEINPQPTDETTRRRLWAEASLRSAGLEPRARTGQLRRLVLASTGQTGSQQDDNNDLRRNQQRFEIGQIVARAVATGELTQHTGLIESELRQVVRALVADRNEPPDRSLRNVAAWARATLFVHWPHTADELWIDAAIGEAGEDEDEASATAQLALEVISAHTSAQWKADHARELEELTQCMQPEQRNGDDHATHPSKAI